MGYRRLRVLAWLTVLVMTAAGLAGPGAAGSARAALITQTKVDAEGVECTSDLLQRRFLA